MSMRELSLPALDGRDPLGFLAALGIVRLLSSANEAVTLSFDPMLATARLRGPTSLTDLVVRLVEIIDSLPQGSLMKGLPPALVPPPSGDDFIDPARLTVSQFEDSVAHASSAEERSWIRSLWTDLGSAETGLCAVTPFYAPTGRQTLRTALEKSAELVFADPGRLLRETIESWRRVNGFTGENLDYRAVRSAAEQPDGSPLMSGVPGATWLALSSIPLFPMGGDGVTPKTLRWQRLRFDGQRGTRLSFSWPIWSSGIDADGIAALLAHSAVDRAATFAVGGPAEPRDKGRVRDQLRALSIERVVVARRRQLPGGKSAGVLVPGASWG